MSGHTQTPDGGLLTGAVTRLSPTARVAIFYLLATVLAGVYSLSGLAAVASIAGGGFGGLVAGGITTSLRRLYPSLRKWPAIFSQSAHGMMLLALGFGALQVRFASFGSIARESHTHGSIALVVVSIGVGVIIAGVLLGKGVFQKNDHA